MSVTSIVSRIRERDKTPRTSESRSATVRDLPVNVFSEIYQGDALSYAGRSKTTMPMIVGLIRACMIGRFSTKYMDKIGQICFDTADGHISILMPSLTAKAVVKRLGL